MSLKESLMRLLFRFAPATKRFLKLPLNVLVNTDIMHIWKAFTIGALRTYRP